MGFLSLLLVVQKNLEVGEVIAVDVACVVALSATVNVQVKYNGPMRRVVFGVSSFDLLFINFNCLDYTYVAVLLDKGTPC